MQNKLLAKKLVMTLVLLACITTGILGLTLPIHDNLDSIEYQEVLQTALTTSQVKTVQTKLKKWGYYTGVVDGIYGTKTKTAVRNFQKKNGLTADGIVGTKTAAALGMSLSKSSSSTQNSGDLYNLAKCIYAEARGELYIGPGVEVYAGEIVGLNKRKEDLEINVCKGKQLTNMRSKSSDGAIQLTPYTQMSLEQCLDFIEDDELLEVTPKNLRLRKAELDPIKRKRANRQYQK